jgi:Glycosyl transferase family 2
VRITVLASMRNEGPFIVEWVCWYRMLGFTDVVVVTNNCTDHSPALLDALAAAGWVQHLRHDVAPGQKITRAKLAAAAELKAVRRSNWLMVCDVDEFLVIHRGAGKIGDLLDLSPTPAYLGMSLNWRVFGTSGLKSFADVPVHRQFVYALRRSAMLSRTVKSIFNQVNRFEQLAEHSPSRYDFAKAGKVWGDPGMAWVNCEGRPLTAWQPGPRHLHLMERARVSHEVAQINHYMLRSVESYSLKKGSASPVALSNRYDDGYFRRADSGDEPDSSAFRYAEDYDVIHAQAMALPDVARLHAQCCADHVRAIVEKAGSRAEDDPRFGAFSARAAHQA